jgi:hypothetical protein
MDGQAYLDVQLSFRSCRPGEVVILPNGQGGRWSLGGLHALGCLTELSSVQWDDMVKGIGRVDLSEEAPHGVGSQDLVAATRS